MDSQYREGFLGAQCDGEVWGPPALSVNVNIYIFALKWLKRVILNHNFYQIANTYCKNKV